MSRLAVAGCGLPVTSTAWWRSPTGPTTCANTSPNIGREPTSERASTSARRYVVPPDVLTTDVALGVHAHGSARQPLWDTPGRSTPSGGFAACRRPASGERNLPRLDRWGLRDVHAVRMPNLVRQPGVAGEADGDRHPEAEQPVGNDGEYSNGRWRAERHQRRHQDALDHAQSPRSDGQCGGHVGEPVGDEQADDPEAVVEGADEGPERDRIEQPVRGSPTGGTPEERRIGGESPQSRGQRCKETPDAVRVDLRNRADHANRHCRHGSFVADE